jgi:hypothetical protein
MSSTPARNMWRLIIEINWKQIVHHVDSYCTDILRCMVYKTLDSENVAAYPVHFQRDGYSIKGSIKCLQIRLYKEVVCRVTVFKLKI